MAVIVILLFLLFCGLLVAGFYAFFMYSLNNKYRKQTIVEDIQVTSEWIEITPDEPLETTKLVQNVQLLIEGYEHDILKDDFGNIQLKNGTYINPEVEIVGENRKTYQLRDGQRSGDLIGFSPNKEIHGTSSFPMNIKYKSIRIRSDKPFICKKVIWNDYNLK
jgi:hypothetical protein